MRNAAEAIAEGLAGAGCRHAFGMPGGEVLVLMDALKRAGIDFTLVKHENAAGFMAEGAWHATGTPGVMLTTIGPGLANGVNAVANAFLEQVPMIVLSGCIAPGKASGFTHQVIDQQALMRPITKASFQVSEGDAGTIIAKAISIAKADPPGPVHIDLPDTLAKSPAPPADAPAPLEQTSPVLADEVLEQALTRLKGAKRPVVLAGIGALLHEAGPEIERLADVGIPVVTTYKAKGIIPETHPQALGGHGLSPKSDKLVLPLLAQSDCVLCLGYDPVEMRADWVRPWKPENALEFCHAQAEHGMHGSSLRWVGNVRAAARALADGIGAHSWADESARATRGALEEAFAPSGKWGPKAVFAALDRREGVFTVDSGAHRILMTQMFHADRPRQLLQSAALCTMGVALPLAIGYKRAAPETPVTAVLGDAGLDMAPGDLATLRDMGLPMTVVVLVDDALTLIARKQAAMQLEETGVRFGRTDFPALAAAYGGHGTLVRDEEALATALDAAAGRETFTLIACEIDKRDYDGAF